MIKMNVTERYVEKEALIQSSSENESSSVHSSFGGTDDENSSDENGVIKTIPLGSQTSNVNLAGNLARLPISLDGKKINNINIQNSTNVHIGHELNVEIVANVKKTLNKRKLLRKHRNQSKNSATSSTSETSTDADEESDENIGTEGFLSNYDLVQRKMWLAQKPMQKCRSLKKPVRFVSISHTETESSTDIGTNIKNVRDLQCYHIEHLKLKDIAYNFLIGCDGAVYEGRGWNVRGAHTNVANKVSIGIAFIGNFSEQLPSREALETFKNFIEKAVQEGNLIQKYEIFCYPHRSLTYILPKALCEEFKKWSRFCDLTKEKHLRNRIMPETFHSKIFKSIRLHITRMFNIIQDFFIYLFRGRSNDFKRVH